MNPPLYFISDIHLGLTVTPEEKSRRSVLLEFIGHVRERKGTLFIVGDLFDFWFEFSSAPPPPYRDIVAALREARSRGPEIHFVPGNHDYWMGRVGRTMFVEIHRDPVDIECGGSRFHITHGDGLLERDRRYRLFRWFIHNPLTIALFRLLPSRAGYHFGKWLSHRGRRKIHSEEHNRNVVEELSEFSRERFRHGADHVVMGHYHLARHLAFSSQTLILLGDWIKFLSFAHFDGTTLSLNYWK